MSKIKSAIKYAAITGALLFGADKVGLALESKNVLVSGYDPQTAEISVEESGSFVQEKLEQLVHGEDIVPGFPEQGAMCSKTMRALVNTLLGEPYFKHHRLFSKLFYKTVGKEELAADKAGIHGDAWNMYYNIQEAGGSLLYKTDTPREDVNKSVEHIIEQVRIGDIIGFYYPDSQYNEVAKQAGAGFTHMGLVVGHVPEENNENMQSIPIVAHLFHADQYYPAEELSLVEQKRKELLARAYDVPLNTIPAFRVEPITAVQHELVFQGYAAGKEPTNQRTEIGYQVGDPLVYPKVVLRPNYNNNPQELIK